MTIADSVIGLPAPTAVLIPDDFLGLSIEWSMVRPWFGRDRAGRNQSLVNLLTGLRRTTTSSGVLRIGGNSQDGHVFDPNGCTEDNSLFAGRITTRMVDAVIQVATDAGWKVTFGLNLRQADPQNAADLVAYATAADASGAIQAFEVGNEPNAYFASPADYLNRVDQYLAVMPANVPITGPAISESADLTYAQVLWNAHQNRMPYATWHSYANEPNLGSLLQTRVITEFRSRIAAMDAAIGGGNSRMGEGNSVGSGGLDGVSNVLGSATWLLDALCAAAGSGQRGFNLHSWDGYYFPDGLRQCFYTPFVVRQGATSPRPPYYALQLAKFVVGRRPAPVTTSVDVGAVVRTWAYQDPGTGRFYALMLNKAGTGHGGAVSLTAPAGHSGTAFVNVLSDGGGCNSHTAAIQGQTLQPDGSMSWMGTAVAPVSPGRWEFNLPECGAALVSLP